MENSNPTKTTTRRKQHISKPKTEESRKNTHKLIEQRRRQRINGRIDELGDLLSTPNNHLSKKSSILEKTIDTILDLHSISSTLLSEQDSLQKEHKTLLADLQKWREKDQEEFSNKRLREGANFSNLNVDYIFDVGPSASTKTLEDEGNISPLPDISGLTHIAFNPFTINNVPPALQMHSDREKQLQPHTPIKSSGSNSEDSKNVTYNSVPQNTVLYSWMQKSQPSQRFTLSQQQRDILNNMMKSNPPLTPAQLTSLHRKNENLNLS